MKKKRESLNLSIPLIVIKRLPAFTYFEMDLESKFGSDFGRRIHRKKTVYCRCQNRRSLIVPLPSFGRCKGGWARCFAKSVQKHNKEDARLWCKASPGQGRQVLENGWQSSRNATSAVMIRLFMLLPWYIHIQGQDWVGNWENPEETSWQVLLGQTTYLKPLSLLLLFSSFMCVCAKIQIKQQKWKRSNGVRSWGWWFPVEVHPCLPILLGVGTAPLFRGIRWKS